MTSNAHVYLKRFILIENGQTSSVHLVILQYIVPCLL